MTGPDELHYLKSIVGMLRQVKDGVAFSRYRSMLGLQVLADNIDWLDCKIDVLERQARREAEDLEAELMAMVPGNKINPYDNSCVPKRRRKP